MYEEEPRNRIPFIAMFAAFVFGFGSLWVGHTGYKIVFHNSNASSHIAFENNTSTGTLATRNFPSPNTASVFDSVTDVNSMLSRTATLIRESIDSVKLPSPSTTILIGGDIMLDRKIRSIGRKNGYDYIFASLGPLFRSADIVVVNLEGPITKNVSKTLLLNGATTKDLTFTFATATAKALSNAGITAVNLANNHTDNFGSQGVADTKQWLKNSNVKWFGSPWNASSTEFVIEKNGMKIGFVGYHAFQSGIDRVINQIRNLSSQGIFVIVMPHWGDEYSTKPTEKMREQARSFINAGAKAVIGAHPHVIMENETIAGVPVYYSIGNLIFDQYFSPEVMKGKIISLELVNGPDGPSLNKINEHFVQMDKVKGVILK